MSGSVEEECDKTSPFTGLWSPHLVLKQSVFHLDSSEMLLNLLLTAFEYLIHSYADFLGLSICQQFSRKSTGARQLLYKGGSWPKVPINSSDTHAGEDNEIRHKCRARTVHKLDKLLSKQKSLEVK